MLDPYKIPRPRFAPRAYPCYQVGRAASRLYPVHTHRGYMNASGVGVTDISASHFHRIKDGKILPDASDGHVHGLTRVLCGYGI
jgi:hypothetical protein